MISFVVLEQYLENADLNLVLKKTKNGIVVSILPKPNIKDKAKENLIPLIIKGTSNELDQQFIKLITTKLAPTTGIISNIAEFEAQSEEMKAKSEAQKKAKEEKTKADEKSKKELDGADKLLAESKFDECQEKIDKSLKNNEKYKPALELQEKLNKFKPQSNQVDIFGVIEEEKAKPQSKPIQLNQEQILPNVQDEPQQNNINPEAQLWNNRVENLNNEPIIKDPNIQRDSGLNNNYNNMF